ncbi:hypothetical protein TNCT_145261, partial [Trichonephila clavata]
TQGNFACEARSRNSTENQGNYALPRLQQHLKSENRRASLMLLLKQQKQPMPGKLLWKKIMNKLLNLGKKSIELP